MGYCWARSKAEGKLLSMISLIMLMFVFFGTISGVFRRNWAYAIVPGLCFLPAFRFWFVASRKYRIRDDGLTVSYPFGITKFYPWDQFTDVGLCWVHPSAGANTSSLAIRCVIGGEQFGPRQASSAREDWAARFYEIRHCKKIVSVYHTPDRMADFQKNCPFPIIDYTGLT